MEREKLDIIRQLKADSESARSQARIIADMVSRWVLPQRKYFVGDKNKTGNKLPDLFDDTAIRANDKFASAIIGGYTNPSSKWFDLIPEDDGDEAVKLYAARVAKDIAKHLADPRTGFYTANKECITSWAAYGVTCMSCRDDGLGGARFAEVPFDEFSFLTNTEGFPDIVIREYNFPLFKAKKMFGAENLSAQAKGRKQTDNIKMFQIALSSETYQEIFDEPAVMPEGKRFISFVMEDYQCHHVSTKYHTARPFIISRYQVYQNESYGCGPAYSCMPSIKNANYFAALEISAAQGLIAPPHLAPDTDVIPGGKIKPGMVISGGMGPQGEPLIRPYIVPVDLNTVMAVLEQHRRAIKEAFYVDAFEERQGTPISAYEYKAREGDKLRLSGSKTTRLEMEYLSQIIESVYTIREEAGVYDKWKKELGGGDRQLNIMYTSPLATNQRGEELYSVSKAASAVAPIAQMYPNMAQEFAGRLDPGKFVAWVAESSGLPADVLKKEEDYVKEQQAAAEAQSAAQDDATLMEGAKAVGASGVDVNKLIGLA